MAFLRSEQMKGHDPKTYHPPVTRQMERISRKRDAFLRDTFYKYAHYICRTMKERGLSYLIIGYNKGQKQDIDLGRKTNQSFVLREVPLYPADGMCAVWDPGHPAGRELYLQSLFREQGLYPDIRDRRCGKHILHRKEGKAGPVPSG